MTPRDEPRAPPLPRGEGAGGEGRSAARSREQSIGWAPREGELRQKDFSHTRARARQMRKEPTSAEAAMWALLRPLNKEGARFRRQLAIARYVFDFGDYSARLVIEVDGAVHAREDVQVRDERKAAHAHANGFHVLRFTNAEVCGRGDWVVAEVRAALASPPTTAPHSARPSPPNPLSTRERGKEDM